ncbi:hypothetical protein [Aquabacterium sp.]|uniref:hypothetical protein n=1 Tax=Aquabacterium sp. TaxID=1872578 RepID=UPI004038138D
MTASTLNPARRTWMATARVGLIGLVGLAGLMAHGLSLAHDDTYLDTLTTPHGGQLRMAGALHLELVVNKAGQDTKERPIEVYVTDHAGTKQPTAGASATITLLSGKHKVTAALKPDGDNKLKGLASYAPTPDLKAIVSVTMPGQDAQQARFTPLAPRAGHTSTQ